MKKIIRTISLLLIFCLLCPMVAPYAHATPETEPTAEPTTAETIPETAPETLPEAEPTPGADLLPGPGMEEIEETDLLQDRLEQMATDYITAYIEEIYLYADSDLSENTIQEVLPPGGDAELTRAVSQQQVTINSETFTVQELCDNITFFDDTAEYYKYTRSVQDIQRYNFRLMSTICDTEIGADYANVHLYTEVSFRYEEHGEPAVGGDNFVIKFIKLNNNWYIADVVSEELVFTGREKGNFNLENEIEEFNEFLQSVIAQEATFVNFTEENTVAPMAFVPNRNYYNQANAVAYAYAYTTSTYKEGTGNNVNFRNTNFEYYSDANCQNFASQCVWAGLGGSNNKDCIQGGAIPMDRDGMQWHGDIKNGPQHSPSWTYTDNFYEYAIASTTATNESGLRCTTEQLERDENFSQFETNPAHLIGAVLHVRGKVDFAHAIIITEATGLNRTDIRYCGNSPMRKQYKLNDNYPNQPIRVIIPEYFEERVNCTLANHIYANHSPWIGCKCTACGHNRLKITGTNPGCIAKGTYTIGGTANYPCYRMAIGITDPAGSTTWKEVLQTQSISTSYTFSNVGLYTVKIAGRNMPNDTNYAYEEESVDAEWTFTIRVY